MSWMTLELAAARSAGVGSCRAMVSLLVRRRAAEQFDDAVAPLLQAVQREIQLGGAVADLVVDRLVGEADQQLAAVAPHVTAAFDEVAGERGGGVHHPIVVHL